MARLTFDISMSLDGFIAGANPGPDQPLGEGGEELHQWVYGLSTWRESHGQSGGETNADSEVLDETVGNAGATIMGRGMFGGGPGPWGDDPWEGWWGDDPPFDIPVFVLTHHAREPLVKGDTTFTFVTDGIESAVEQAKAAAGDKDVSVMGSAAVQECLRAGLLDEIHLHLIPVVLGGGVRTLDNVGSKPFELECFEVVDAPGVTHLSYRVLR